MRIQDTNEILNEARIQRLDAGRHHAVENGSMWDKMKVDIPQLLRRKHVQAGLVAVGSALVTAAFGMLVSPRARRSTFNLGRK